MSAAKPAALVTGGARGIGRAIVRHLLSSGWHVGIIDVPDSGLRRAFARERNVFVIEADVRDEASASDAVEATIHRFQRLGGGGAHCRTIVRAPRCHTTLPER